jgi:hypothetical protein
MLGLRPLHSPPMDNFKRHSEDFLLFSQGILEEYGVLLPVGSGMFTIIIYLLILIII